jgi:hypothetical protein
LLIDIFNKRLIFPAAKVGEQGRNGKKEAYKIKKMLRLFKCDETVAAAVCNQFKQPGKKPVYNNYFTLLCFPTLEPPFSD